MGIFWLQLHYEQKRVIQSCVNSKYGVRPNTAISSSYWFLSVDKVQIFLKSGCSSTVNTWFTALI